MSSRKNYTLNLTPDEARMISYALDAIVMDEDDYLATAKEKKVLHRVVQKLSELKIYSAPLAEAK